VDDMMSGSQSSCSCGNPLPIENCRYGSYRGGALAFWVELF
jgi:hypothetical protein